MWCACVVDADGRCACDSTGGVVATGAQASGVDLRDCAVLSEDLRVVGPATRARVATLLVDQTPAGGHRIRGLTDDENVARR
jgi:hypothetical protein